MSDSQQFYGCPEHPAHGMAAIVQQTYQVPVTIIKSGGRFEIEQSPLAEFVRELSTEMTIAYTCAHPECAFAVTPELLGELKEHRGR